MHKASVYGVYLLLKDTNISLPLQVVITRRLALINRK